MKRKSIIPIIIAICFNMSCEDDDSAGKQQLTDIDIMLTSILQNNNKYLEFTYDSLNRLVHSDLYYDDTTYSRTTYSYDSGSRLTGKNYDGYIETYEYGVDGLLKSMTKLYPSTNKVWKRMFIYESGNITSAEIFYDDVQTDYAIYEYDAKGNTAEISEYTINTENNDFVMVHQKFSYDDAPNPLSLIGYTPVDIEQTNNPVHVYYGNALMCRGPIEYDAAYEYYTNGLPLKEHRTYKGSSNTDEFTYNYQLILK